MPERHPTGMVTFLFTDVESTTPPGWRARQKAILRAAIAAHGGWAYKQIGDAFPPAPAALAAAVAAQQALAAEA